MRCILVYFTIRFILLVNKTSPPVFYIYKPITHIIILRLNYEIVYKFLAVQRATEMCAYKVWEKFYNLLSIILYLRKLN